METQAAIERQAILGNITALWKKTLAKDVGPEDDFFDAGGDSLKAIIMITEVQSTYNVEIDVEMFFEDPSINKLADTLVALLTAKGQK